MSQLTVRKPILGLLITGSVPAGKKSEGGKRIGEGTKSSEKRSGEGQGQKNK